MDGRASVAAMIHTPVGGAPARRRASHDRKRGSEAADGDTAHPSTSAKSGGGGARRGCISNIPADVPSADTLSSRLLHHPPLPTAIRGGLAPASRRRTRPLQHPDTTGDTALPLLPMR